MPGLIGVVSSQAADAVRDRLVEMARALRHHEWYQVHAYHADGIGLGRVSLGILNPEPQPIWNEDRSLCIIMEGEVYDYAQEKRDLEDRGHRFKVGNDADYVLHLYEEWGEDGLVRLNGAFVAAIWDTVRQRLTLFNDRLGLRPLYYVHRDGGLAFAAGVRALLTDASLPRRIDALAVAQYLSFDYALGDRTLIEDVHLLPPASILTLSEGHLALRSYWQLEFADVCQVRSQEEYLEATVYYLRQAVRRQARDDLPAGVSLSGGLDSRTIVGFLCEQGSGPKIHTFSYGIPNCDDARLAAEVSALVGATHHFYELKPDYLRDITPEGVWLTDGMKSCRHMHPLATLHEQAAHVRVMYIGFLGDPLMGGHLGRELWAEYEEDELARLLFAHTNTLCSPDELALLLSDEFASAAGVVYDSFREALAESKARLVANRQNHFDLRQRQRRLIVMGHEQVRSRLAVRTPFCDNDLVEFMLTVPPGYRLDRVLHIEALVRTFPDLAKVPYEGTGLPLVACARSLCIQIGRQMRWRLRAAGLKWVPELKAKPYADYDGWLRTALRDWTQEVLLGEEGRRSPLFKPEAARRLVDEHLAGAANAAKLGVLLSLELWRRRARV